LVCLLSHLRIRKALLANFAPMIVKLPKVVLDTVVLGQLPEVKSEEEQKRLMWIGIMIPCQQTVWLIGFALEVPA
jgi:hypothetical protein